MTTVEVILVEVMETTVEIAAETRDMMFFLNIKGINES